MPVYTETKTLKSLKLVPDLAIIIVEHTVTTLKDGVPISEKVEGRSYSNLQIADFEMDIAPSGASIADIVEAFNEAAIGQRDAAVAQQAPTTAALAAAQAQLVTAQARIAELEAQAATPSTPVTSVTPRQMRQALTQMGLRGPVEAAVAAADQDLQDWWEYSNAFERERPQVVAMAQALGVSDAQLDALWALAATL